MNSANKAKQKEDGNKTEQYETAATAATIVAIRLYTFFPEILLQYSLWNSGWSVCHRLKTTHALRHITI